MQRYDMQKAEMTAWFHTVPNGSDRFEKVRLEDYTYFFTGGSINFTIYRTIP
ncbi:MAG: hypothetical protein IJX44_08830 [Bacteroidaceae bacterium]|nr:hypothetical protein [Bacteroidaceae bacterium]